MNKLLLIAASLFLLVHCTSTRPSTGTSAAKVTVDRIPVKIKLFHFRQDSTRVYFQIETRSHDYFLLQEKQKYRVAYNLTYELTGIQQGKKQKLDSTSMRIVDLSSQPMKKNISGFFDIKTAGWDECKLKVTLVNTDNHADYENNLRFNKGVCDSPEFILITDESNKPLIDKNFIEDKGKIMIGKTCGFTPELYQLTGGQDYPTPPFADDDFGSKNYYSSIKMNLNRIDSTSFGFSLPDKGYYFISTKNGKAISFAHYTKWFPQCNDTAAFYQPLIYITSREEFDQFEDDILASKATFESFWLTKAGTKEKARVAIKEYYKRVFECNLEYSSVKEGWKTDRGMIFIIFGRPWKVEKHMNKETWIYRTAFNAVLTFDFLRIDNPYSDNDYRLYRDPASRMKYKQQWYNAVENWRNGRIFTLNGN